MTTTAPDAATPPQLPEHNRTGVDFRAPMPRPKVRGVTIDFHCHLFASRHGPAWFEAADHYGIDCFLTMTPLEDAVGLQRDYGHRVQFIAVPKWQEFNLDDWLRRIEAFYNMGSRILKIHAAPQTMASRGYTLESESIQRVIKEAVDRKMAVMTHLGDPDTWYASKYTDHAKYGTREQHYQMWERVLEQHRGHPWIGAHMGGNPENLPRLQHLLDTYPDLMLDMSATRWMVREISARRDAARDFVIRNQDRLLFGTDQVSGDDRGFDFLASRFWSHRKLWDTAYIGPCPIVDPDLPADQQPMMRGLALPDQTLQRIYHDNATNLLARLGMTFPGWG